MDTEPIAVALKFGFLAVLYLFLFWVSRSALRELRRTTAPAPEATGFHPVGPGGRAAATDENVMPHLVDCARAYASEGEICDALRAVWGVYRETPVF